MILLGKPRKIPGNGGFFDVVEYTLNLPARLNCSFDQKILSARHRQQLSMNTPNKNVANHDLP